MVTVWDGRSSSSTLSAASLVTVPPGSSSPEQATMPTLRCGRLGIACPAFLGIIHPRRNQLIADVGNFRSQSLSQRQTALVQFGDACRLQASMLPVEIQHGIF